MLLNAATDKFSRRFQAMEAEVRRQGKQLTDLSLAEMDVIWERVKDGEHDANCEKGRTGILICSGGHVSVYFGTWIPKSAAGFTPSWRRKGFARLPSGML